MSEHLAINGKVNYWHLPYDEPEAMTFCNHCEETLSRATLEFHEGIVEDWMVLKCPKCKKSIWTSKLNRKQTGDDKKCVICKKPTNWIDCFSSGGRLGDKTGYWCSKKCHSVSDRIFFEECYRLDELSLCAEKQRIELDPKIKLKLAKENV